MISLQTSIGTRRSSKMIETSSCGYLLQELQARMIWNEIGEDKFEREKVLVELEQECVEVCRKKVDVANTLRARFHQQLADAKAEFTHLLLSLGELWLPERQEKMAGTLKEQLDSITPALREIRLKKEERLNQFRTVKVQIQKISSELESDLSSKLNLKVNENDLSLKKLEEYRIELQRIHNEKNERLEKVEKYIDTIHKLSTILGIDSSKIISEVHPSLNNDLYGVSKNIGKNVLAKLEIAVQSLMDEKKNRLEKLHQLGKNLANLWNLMDTRHEDRRFYDYFIRLSLVSSSEVLEPGSLTQNIVVQAEAEVKRLDQLKASKMKELFLKKQRELEDICHKSHMEIPLRVDIDNIVSLIRTGEIDHADLVLSMDEKISKAKEESFSRKAIMDKVEKWLLACDEERWLEDYSRDDNRYSVSRGAHRNLRRAERARIMVNKIPVLMDTIIEKTMIWEEERQKVFLYDEAPLLAMLEEYNAYRVEKEAEKSRQREKKKIQNVIEAWQETPIGPRPSASSRRSASLGHNKRNLICHGIVSKSNHSLRDETASVVSTFSGPVSP